MSNGQSDLSEISEAFLNAAKSHQANREKGKSIKDNNRVMVKPNIKKPQFVKGYLLVLFAFNFNTLFE